MAIELNTIATVLMEIFALLYFLMVFLSKRYSHSLSSLRSRLENEGNGAWSFNFLFPTKRLISPSALLMAVIMIAIFIIGVLLSAVFFLTGYVFLIGLIGLGILLDSDVFEAYRYCRAAQEIQKKTPDQLSFGDRKYLDEVKEVLEVSAIRFTLAGVTFAAAGPFIPQILSNILYGFALYASIGFAAAKVFNFLGIFVFVLFFVISLMLTKKLLFKIIGKLRQTEKND